MWLSFCSVLDGVRLIVLLLSLQVAMNGICAVTVTVTVTVTVAVCGLTFIS